MPDPTPRQFDADAFAEALDAMTRGMSPVRADDPLVTFAGSLERPQALDAGTKGEIWQALLQGQASATTAPLIPAAGGAGSALALNPWSPRQANQPRARRTSSGVLRFIPAVQPSSSFIMVVLVMVLIGAAFSWIAPNQSFAPAALASPSPTRTEEADATATSTPVVIAERDIPWIDESVVCDRPNRTYEEYSSYLDSTATPTASDLTPVGPASAEDAATIMGIDRAIGECWYHGDAGQWRSYVTPRFIATNDGSIEPVRVRFPTLEEAKAATDRLFPYGAPPVMVTSADDASSRDEIGQSQNVLGVNLPEYLVAFSDGRIGGPISTLIPGNYRDLGWFPDTKPWDQMVASGYSIYRYAIYARDETTGGEWALDELFLVCGGDCESFYAQYEELSASPMASPSTALASPPSSLTEGADSCTTPQTGPETLAPRMYRIAGVLNGQSPDAIAVAQTWASINICGGVDNPGSTVPSFTTSRYQTDQQSSAWALNPEEALAVLGNEPTSAQLDAWQASWESNPGRSLESMSQGDPLLIEIAFVDRRIAIYSAEYWLRRMGRLGESTHATSGEIVTLHVLASQGGQWLYDESIDLCTGACESFETRGSSKPVLTAQDISSAPSQWLYPRDHGTDFECDDSGPVFLNPAATAVPEELNANNYLPFGKADSKDQEAAAIAYSDVTMTCGWGMGTEPLESLPMVPFGKVDVPGTLSTQITTAQAISESLEVRDPIELVYVDETATIDTEGKTIARFVLFPEHVVQLPDGRFGALAREIVQPGDPVSLIAGGMELFPFVVFAPVADGRMEVDEIILVCVGDCADYWARGNVTTPIASPINSIDSTPVIDILASPNTSAAALIPVSAEECAVEPRATEQYDTYKANPPATEVARTYYPAAPADASTEGEVIAATRSWHACKAYGEVYQPNALESPRSIWEQNGGRFDSPEALAARQAEAAYFAETIVKDDWQHYLIETSSLPNDSDAEAFAIVQPGDVFQLPDGRVAVVISELVPEGTIAKRSAWTGHLADVQVYVRDATQDNAWVLDERLRVCIGECGETREPPFTGTPVSDPASCGATEIHSEPSNTLFIKDDLLGMLPWVMVETDHPDVVIIGLLWYGNRPLEPNGEFEGGAMNAKFMWVTNRGVGIESVSAVPIDDLDATPVILETGVVGSGEWPMGMDLPTPGCWEVTVTGTVSGTDESFTATIVMEVIAPPTGTPTD